MKIFGQIESASLEQLSADPVASTQGRIWQNTSDGHTKVDSGTVKKAFLLNDELAIIGSDSTTANNVRIHRGGPGIFQDVLGNDSTVDGTMSSSLAQRSTRVENHTDALLPSAGNAGRNVFVTDKNIIAVDDGTNWRKIVLSYAVDDNTSGTNVAISSVTSSVIRLTNAALVSIQTIAAGFSAQEVTIVNRTGVVVSIINNAGSPAENRILTGTGGNYIIPVDGAISLKYDSSTQSWQSMIASLTLTAPATAAISTKTANYTITPSDATIILDASAGSFNITLPSPGDVINQKFTLKREDSVFANSVTVIGSIDGQSDWSLWTAGEVLEFHSDGSAYHKLRHIAKTEWVSAGSVVNFYQMTITTPTATGVSALATYTNNGNTYTVAKTIGAQAYSFTLSPAASASAGAVYSNNGKSFTVLTTISGGTTLSANGTGIPSASGVLTKVSGVGDAAINFSTSSVVLTVVGTAAPAAGTMTRTSGTGDATLTLLSFAGSAQALSATTTTPIFNTTPSVNTFMWKRDGKHVTFWVNFYQTAAGVSAGVGDILWPSVAGINLDTTIAPAFTSGPIQAAVGATAVNAQGYYPNLANGFLSNNAAAFMQVTLAAAYSSSKYRIFGSYANGALYSPGSTYIPATAVVAYNFQVTLPAQYWKE